MRTSIVQTETKTMKFTRETVKPMDATVGEGGVSVLGWVRCGGGEGDVPWPVRPTTMMAKRNCTARMTRRISSSMVVEEGGVVVVE